MHPSIHPFLIHSQLCFLPSSTSPPVSHRFEHVECASRTMPCRLASRWGRKLGKPLSCPLATSRKGFRKASAVYLVLEGSGRKEPLRVDRNRRSSRRHAGRGTSPSRDGMARRTSRCMHKQPRSQPREELFDHDGGAMISFSTFLSL